MSDYCLIQTCKKSDISLERVSNSGGLWEPSEGLESEQMKPSEGMPGAFRTFGGKCGKPSEGLQKQKREMGIVESIVHFPPLKQRICLSGDLSSLLSTKDKIKDRADDWHED